MSRSVGVLGLVLRVFRRGHCKASLLPSGRPAGPAAVARARSALDGPPLGLEVAVACIVSCASPLQHGSAPRRHPPQLSANGSARVARCDSVARRFTAGRTRRERTEPVDGSYVKPRHAILAAHAPPHALCIWTRSPCEHSAQRARPYDARHTTERACCIWSRSPCRGATPVQIARSAAALRCAAAAKGAAWQRRGP